MSWHENVHNGFSAYCAHEGEAGTDEVVRQALINVYAVLQNGPSPVTSM